MTRSLHAQGKCKVDFQSIYIYHQFIATFAQPSAHPSICLTFYLCIRPTLYVMAVPSQARLSQRWSPLRLTLLIFLIITAVLAAIFWMPSSRHDLRQVNVEKRAVPLPMNRTVDWNISSLPTFRSTILPHGARVACWPSTGGIWIKHVPPVELDYLFLSRKNDTQRPLPPMTHFWWAPGRSLSDEDMGSIKDHPLPVYPPPISEEDLFCQMLRTIGAEFWEIPPEKSLQGAPIEYVMEPKYRNELAFWWERWGRGTSLVNLTEASTRLGSIEFNQYLNEYNNADTLPDRYASIKALGALTVRVHTFQSFQGKRNVRRCGVHNIHNIAMRWIGKVESSIPTMTPGLATTGKDVQELRYL
jgi:hypothetical protein